ncbi:hypothetical protein [uncultured Methylobacterium sp.]|jgi:hypothetical protein|uniref:hypothetical protein n=1 Tax=uncultured Methylobacterium sp. TaxID=157278 RepID=UPI002635DDB1|nr:hypothetical protein [uncultured Methylobacterium sp.]
MFGPWYSATMLALESQTVIGMRLAKVAWGGEAGRAEAQRMVSEKVDAAIEAADMLLSGGSPDAVIARYREHVRANAERLSAL